ncbi:Cytochrome P450 [Mycena venus]|uniref:Cytochrome P450 n=1 Tax=Mycena venus TaxID=2733690 RepID=A0A8H7CMB9_9AGAR|nr:Cytochrome P450 [Mycena venus]
MRPPGITAATWALFEIAKSPEIQTRLRNELLAVDTENPTMDELNALPYLDCVGTVAKASLTCSFSVRVAMRDDVIPLETPYTDRNGTVHETIRQVPSTAFLLLLFKFRRFFRLTKGQEVAIPILAINRDPAIWGPDADQFIPERWERSPAISTSIPGLWSSMLTFLGGPRACIGFRFSLVEYVLSQFFSHIIYLVVMVQIKSFVVHPRAVLGV